MRNRSCKGGVSSLSLSRKGAWAIAQKPGMADARCLSSTGGRKAAIDGVVGCEEEEACGMPKRRQAAANSSHLSHNLHTSCTVSTACNQYIAILNQSMIEDSLASFLSRNAMLFAGLILDAQ